MNLMELCEPIFLKVCGLTCQSADREGQDYARVRAEWKSLFENLRQRAGTEGRLPAQYRQVEAMLVGFVDLMIARSRLPFARQWDQNRLAVEQFNSMTEQIRFIDLLEEALGDPSDEATERLAVFYVCLGLGYAGVVDPQSHQVRAYMEAIIPRIRQWVDPDLRASLCPEAYAHNKTVDAYIASDRNWKRVLLVLSGSGALIGAFAAVTFGLWVLWLSVLLPVLVVGECRVREAYQHKKAYRRFLRALNEDVAGARSEGNDPSQQALLDRSRRHYMDAIQAYEKRGKSLQVLPWIFVLGEAGSGRTSAIRRSYLDFLPEHWQDHGDQDQPWWLTNHGVVVDAGTAGGGMILPETRGYGAHSTQWHQFLKLLSEYRPRYPVDGLILVLPADSLLKDSASLISGKASRLAQTIDALQRTVETRLPVHVLVTKCDLLTGFCEFFAHLDDPVLQEQILGWSNPEAPEVPFQPEALCDYLAKSPSLRRRRLALLRALWTDRGPQTQWIEEVARLYALPQSIALLASPLRQYLETIFVSGACSANPPFLVGVYFCSAEQRGCDLDQELWRAFGETSAGQKPCPLAPRSKWEQQRSLFLRDFFIKKAFLESDLLVRVLNQP